MAVRRSKAKDVVEPPRRRHDRAEAGEAPRARSSAYHRARRDRGAETRAQLLAAALEVFGRLGFEGATTRQIAKAANANLAAIVYHFGSKEALHLATAEHVVGCIAAKIGPTLAKVASARSTASPEAARAALHQLIETLIEVMLGSDEAELWARFIVREQLQPTAAFEVIYRFLGGVVETATLLAATVLGRPEDETIRLRVFTVIGQVIVFRVGQTLVLRRMEWRAIGSPERRKIRRVVLENIDAILAGDRP